MKKTNYINVHLVQFSIAWENKRRNYKKVSSLLKKASPKSGSVICLPELFATGYTMNPSRFKEGTKKSPTCDFLASLAVQHKSFVIGSLVTPSKSRAKPFNSAVVFSPKGKIIYQYDKIHLFPLGKEHKVYKKGEGIGVFRIKGKLFSILICFDLRFPELFRFLYAKNVTGIFLPANWPSARQKHWKALTLSRAIENQCYIFGVNRTGRDPHNKYKGGTCIIHPTGETLISSGKEGIISYKIDLNASSAIKKKYPFNKSRSIDVYKNFLPYK